MSLLEPFNMPAVVGGPTTRTANPSRRPRARVSPRAAERGGFESGRVGSRHHSLESFGLWRRLRWQTYDVFDRGTITMYGISALILLNVGFAAFMTDEDKDGVPDDPRVATFYFWFEGFSTIVFTLEYGLRLWSCVEMPGGPVTAWPSWLVPSAPRCCHNVDCLEHTINRLTWATNPMTILDLVVLAVFYLDLVLDFASEFPGHSHMKGVASTLRGCRLLQFSVTMLRLESQSRAFRQIKVALFKRGSDLAMCVFLAGMLVIMAATLIYMVEGKKHLADASDDFDECKIMTERFSSVSRCMYWAAMTITTVGYGDMHPCTTSGQMIAIGAGFAGVAVVALPTGIIGSALVEVLDDAKAAKAAAAQEQGFAGRGTAAQRLAADLRGYSVGTVGAAGDVEIRATGGGGGRGSSRSSSRSPRGGSRDGSPQPSAARGGYSLSPRTAPRTGTSPRAGRRTTAGTLGGARAEDERGVHRLLSTGNRVPALELQQRSSADFAGAGGGGASGGGAGPGAPFCARGAAVFNSLDLNREEDLLLAAAALFPLEYPPLTEMAAEAALATSEERRGLALRLARAHIEAGLGAHRSAVVGAR